MNQKARESRADARARRMTGVTIARTPHSACEER